MQAEAEEDYEFLEQLIQSRELNALVKAHNVILFCNQVAMLLNFFWQDQML
jgi:hypothetical protein